MIEKLIYELKSEPSSTANVVSPDDMSEDLTPNEAIGGGSQAVTDQLGFYLVDAKTRAQSTDGDLLATATQWNKKADEIVLQKKQVILNRNLYSMETVSIYGMCYHLC